MFVFVLYVFVCMFILYAILKFSNVQKYSSEIDHRSKFLTLLLEKMVQILVFRSRDLLKISFLIRS